LTTVVGQVDFGRLMMNIRAEEQKAGRRCIVATGISTKKKYLVGGDWKHVL